MVTESLVVSVFLKEMIHCWTIITCSLLPLFLRYDLSMLFCNIVEPHYLSYGFKRLCQYQQIDNVLHYQYQAMQCNRIESIEAIIESDELTLTTYMSQVLAGFGLSSWPVIWMSRRTSGALLECTFQFTSIWKECTSPALRSLCCLSQSAVNGWLGHWVQKLILHLNYSTNVDVTTL